MAQKLRIEYVQFYTDGSSAKKLDVAAPVKEKEPAFLPKTFVQKRKRIYVDPVAIVGVVVAVCMFFTLAIGMIQLRSAQQDRYNMEQYVIHLQKIHTEREEDYAASYNLEEIEKTALALGMVPLSEVSHAPIDMTEPVVQVEPTIWETVGTFLTGLFA